MDFTECNGTHAASMTCWLCSDRLPWWRSARIKAGLGAEPPFTHPNRIWEREPEYAPSAYAGIRYGENIWTRRATA